MCLWRPRVLCVLHSAVTYMGTVHACATASSPPVTITLLHDVNARDDTAL